MLCESFMNPTPIHHLLHYGKGSPRPFLAAALMAKIDAQHNGVEQLSAEVFA
jgi:hypothetical protein